MVCKHAFNCIQCRQQLTFKTNNANCDNPKLPSLFQSELEKFVREKYKADADKLVTRCMGRLLHLRSPRWAFPTLPSTLKRIR